MKHKPFALFAGLALLGLLAVGCGSLAASARGWARPVATDQLYLISPERGRLDAIDRETSRGTWRFPDFWAFDDDAAADTDGIYGAPIIAEDGDTVFLGDYNGFVYMFRISDAPATPPATEAEAPPAAYLDLGDPVIGGLLLDESSNTLYATAGRHLYAIDITHLERRFQNPDAEVVARRLLTAEKDIWASPARLDNGNIVVASLDGNLYAVDPATGQEVWRFRGGDSGLVSTPTLLGDTILVGSFNSRVFAVDSATGEERWRFKAHNWVWSQPRSDNGTLYFGDFSGILYAVDRDSGEEIWRTDLGRGQIIGAPLLTDSVIVVATQEGWLIGVDPDDRSKLWERDVGTAINADPVLIDGRVIIAPQGCVTPSEATAEVFYFAVDPQTGELQRALDIC